jgi:hypothetical protein
MILVFSGVLMVGSLIALCLPLIPWINRWRPIADWKRDDVLAFLEKTRDEVRNIFSEAGGFAMEPYNPHLVSPVWNMLNTDLSQISGYEG